MSAAEQTQLSFNFDPLEMVRYHEGPKVFGLKPSALKAKIDAGKIPTPIPLSEGGRALGWTRQTIMNHHAKMAALAEQRKKEAGPKVKQEQPPALVRKPKIKKMRLHPPGKSKPPSASQRGAARRGDP